MYAISHARVDISGSITMNAVREAIIAVRKELPIAQTLTVRGNVEAVDVRWSCGVILSREGMNSRIGHINVLEVWADLDAVWSDEVVSHRLYDACVWLEAVDLRSDAGCWAEVSATSSTFLLVGPSRWEARTASSRSERQ